MTDLSARLRTHGLTLSDFRRWIGKSQRQVEAWSRGENSTPHYVLVLLDLMDLLAEARPGGDRQEANGPTCGTKS